MYCVAIWASQYYSILPSVPFNPKPLDTTSAPDVVERATTVPVAPSLSTGFAQINLPDPHLSSHTE